MKTEMITTHDLRLGDVILSDGMVLKIDQEPQQTCHPVDNAAAGITLATRALIVNWDDMVERAKVDTYITGFIVGRVRDEMNRGAINEPRWTIQGNGWARWTRALEAVT
ncbi:hypothetical protein [Mycolicibacterium aubagnense]|uniref:Phage protein n=1 Tax=Mycolicibacterium aubagnense TaxID=319707 RepID=A0ABM7I6I2_9MYCO|nr:hypothetical protein [Mycolicibacterium aubagnense]TLH64422.1 hypothetical protein C1S80_12105 [Mycolicibacterium aubagnense]BBX82153.1 hypothetical protein MAUB_00260 [Mycolicibacterium aubagnense]